MKTNVAIAIAAALIVFPAALPAQAAPPAAAEVAPDYGKKIQVLYCIFNKRTGEWKIQLKNTTREEITLETLGIALRDHRSIEVGRSGARNVILKPGLILTLQGKVEMSGKIDYSKVIKAEPIFNPKDPDTYID